MFQLKESHDIAGGFDRAVSGLIGAWEAISIALGQHSGAIVWDKFTEMGFHFGPPTADHSFQLLVEQIGIRNFPVRAHIQYVAERGDAAFIQRVGPAQNLGAGGVRQ